MLKINSKRNKINTKYFKKNDRIRKSFQEVVESIDRQFADLRKDFSVVDTKIANFGQVSARIGERLKVKVLVPADTISRV